MLKTNSCLRLVKSEAMFQNVYTIFIKLLNTPTFFMEWSAVYLHNHKENYSEPTCFIGNTLYHHQRADF